MREEILKRYEMARQFAIDGGNTTLDHFRSSSLTVERKGDNSPVTIADRNAEKWIRAKIEDQFPDDAIVGEEFGESDGKSGFRWILDPIDGTKSFICGVPLYGSMIGVESEGTPTIGAIYFPGLETGIYGCLGEPTLHGSGTDLAEASVSDTDQLSNAVFVTSESKTFAERDAASVYSQLEDTCYVTRTWGDCYGYYLVATGQVDLMIDPILSIWDAAAVLPIMVGAGGVFCDWKGDQRIDAGESIGTNSHLCDSILSITRDFAGKFPQ